MRVNVDAVAPAMVVQLVDPSSENCQTKLRVGTGLPEKVTALVRVEPTAKVPVGAAVLVATGELDPLRVTVAEDSDAAAAGVQLKFPDVPPNSAM